MNIFLHQFMYIDCIVFLIIIYILQRVLYKKKKKKMKGTHIFMNIVYTCTSREIFHSFK